MLKDYIELAITNIKHRKLRSWLTVIGIIIGITAIISLITISQGLENAIQSQFEQIGSNRIYITPKGTLFALTEEGLTTKDIDTLEKITELKWINPFLVNSEEVEFNRKKVFIQAINGVKLQDLEKIWSDYGINLQDGRFLVPNEKGSVMIGYRLANIAFDKKIKVNHNIKIKEQQFKVAGIFEEVGNSDDDNMVLMNIDESRELFNQQDKISAIEVVVKKGLNTNEVAKKIDKKLERARDDENYDILTPEQILKSLGSVLTIVQIILTSIATISLIVGGIGIMNSMYTSVLERRKEIGIMKSVGARNSDILLLFLIESSLMGLVGGLLGTLIGILISLGVGYGAETAGFKLLKIIIDFKLVSFGILFSTIVGALSGILPAYQASKLNVLECIRYD